MEVVAGVRVTTATEEGFAIALTNTGDVYSWGKSYRGRLGHPTADNQRTPKLVEALAGKDCKQVSQFNCWSFCWSVWCSSQSVWLFCWSLWCLSVLSYTAAILH